jgi:uncharacterized phiE125 gp8 family phage protein
MSLRLTVTSPVQSFDEPLLLSEVETYLNLPGLSPVDEERDYLLQGFIRAAREVAEMMQGRDLVAKQWDLTLDTFPSGPIDLREDLSTVDLFQRTDSDGTVTALVAGTDYDADTSPRPGIVRPVYGGSWPSFTPRPTSAVLVRFTTAPADVNDMITSGMKLLISQWYNGRLPFERAGLLIAEYPFAVTALLSAGRVERFK